MWSSSHILRLLVGSAGASGPLGLTGRSNPFRNCSQKRMKSERPILAWDEVKWSSSGDARDSAGGEKGHVRVVR